MISDEVNFMTGVEQIVKDKTLTFEQKVVALARYARIT